MTKTKSQKMRAKGAKKNVKGKKSWEFNLIKTGNNQLAFESGNSMGNVGRNARMPQDVSAVRNAPKSRSSGGDKSIEMDEFIALVNGSLTFEATAYAIQPGLSRSFPFGAKIASLYERYRVEAIEYYFKPLVSGYAVGGQAGKVLLSCDYDALTALPASTQEVEAMDPHADGMPYQSISLFLDPRRCTPPTGKFTRTGMVAGGDVKTYDSGVLYACAAGNQETVPVGELRVRYKFSLMNPRLVNVTRPPPCNCSSVYTWNNAPFSITSGGTLAKMQGASFRSNPGIALGITGTGGDFFPPVGTYIITIGGSLAAAGGASAVNGLGIQIQVNGTQIAAFSESLATGLVLFPSFATQTAYTIEEGDVVTFMMSVTTPVAGAAITSYGLSQITFHMI
jgi:hypothetical protein